jgi:hypothetical protein
MTPYHSSKLLTFPLTGTSIWLYTSQSSKGGKYSVAIDGEEKGTFDTYSSAPSNSSTGCQAQALYSVTDLEDTSHVLVLKNEGNSRGDGVIDFLGFRLAATGSVNAGGQEGGGAKSKSDTAAIIGGVIGGLAGLILIA